MIKSSLCRKTLKNNNMRKLFTFDELKALDLLAITVTSNVINPNEWYYTKYPDGHYWPFDKI